MSVRARGERTAAGRARGPDPELFPPAFLRLLGAVPTAVRRLRAGAREGDRATPGEGGRFLFRGHRAYRPGDDLRRLDWKVAARLGRFVLRQYDAERDLRTEVWLDGSASLAPFGGRRASARAAALGCAVGLASGGRTLLGVLRDGVPRPLVDASQPGHLSAFLDAIAVEAPASRADLEAALPRLRARLPRDARLLLVSDLLSRAEPGVLRTFAGRGLRGALLHLRVPEVTAPAPQGLVRVEDAETGRTRTVLLDGRLAARVAARARGHAERWKRHAVQVGLRYMAFAPATPDETVLRHLVEEVS